MILSGEMMLRYSVGGGRRPDLSSMEAAIVDKQVTYDFARLMEDATRFPARSSGRR